MKTVMFAVTLAILSCALCRPASAHTFRGSVEIQAPVGQPDRLVDHSLMLVGNLALPDLLSPFGLSFQVKHQLRTTLPYAKEDQFTTELTLPLTRRLTLFADYNSRYNNGDSRIYIGARMSFSGRY